MQESGREGGREGVGGRERGIRMNHGASPHRQMFHFVTAYLRVALGVQDVEHLVVARVPSPYVGVAHRPPVPNPRTGPVLVVHVTHLNRGLVVGDHAQQKIDVRIAREVKGHLHVHLHVQRDVVAGLGVLHPSAAVVHVVGGAPAAVVGGMGGMPAVHGGHLSATRVAGVSRHGHGGRGHGHRRVARSDGCGDRRARAVIGTLRDLSSDVHVARF